LAVSIILFQDPERIIQQMAKAPNRLGAPKGFRPKIKGMITTPAKETGRMLGSNPTAWGRPRQF
jgi:hypothetical protein